MSRPSTDTDHRADPDSLVALLPVIWDPTQVELLADVHPQVWAEPIAADFDTSDALASFTVGDVDSPVDVRVDEPIDELVEMIATAKHPFTPEEASRLEEHRSVWRLTMEDVSQAPIRRSHAFARFVSTAIEAGAPGVFFPFCLQLHSPQLVKQLAVDFGKPPALINLFVGAWNDDEWMITRGLTVFGLPELETPIDDGLNAAYFRLMDVAAGMLVQRDPYPDGARLEMGPRLFRIEQGGRGPDDSMLPICGVYGRMSVLPL